MPILRHWIFEVTLASISLHRFFNVCRELAGDSEGVMNIFRNHCVRLKKLGTIVLRGRTVPTDVEHLVPVRPSRWDRIFPAPSQKPNRVYAMNEADRVAYEDRLEDWTAQDIMMIMNSNLQDSDSSSEEDDLDLDE